MLEPSVSVESEARDGAVAADVALERLLGAALERDLAAGELDQLDLLVRGQEAAGKDLQEAVQRRILVLERRDMDEVLHGVGGDDERVVALRVGRDETGAAQGHADLGREERADAVRAIHGHSLLAVADPENSVHDEPRRRVKGGPGAQRSL